MLDQFAALLCSNKAHSAISIRVITAKSVQSLATAERTAAMINMNGIIPTNCFPNITYHGSTSGKRNNTETVQGDSSDI